MTQIGKISMAIHVTAYASIAGIAGGAEGAVKKKTVMCKFFMEGM